MNLVVFSSKVGILSQVDMGNGECKEKNTQLRYFHRLTINDIGVLQHLYLDRTIPLSDIYGGTLILLNGISVN